VVVKEWRIEHAGCCGGGVKGLLVAGLAPSKDVHSRLAGYTFPIRG
jgi:hypothetical protein